MVIIDSDSRAVGFSLRTGYYLCQCSLAAYGGADDWAEKLALGDTMRSFACGAFHGFVAAHRDMAIVAFRGTETIGNALTDLETALIRYEIFPGLVHLGFAHAAEAVYPTVHALLTALGRELPIWVTGHSLGGAMATWLHSVWPSKVLRSARSIPTVRPGPATAISATPIECPTTAS